MVILPAKSFNSDHRAFRVRTVVDKILQHLHTSSISQHGSTNCRQLHHQNEDTVNVSIPCLQGPGKMFSFADALYIILVTSDYRISLNISRTFYSKIQRGKRGCDLQSSMTYYCSQDIKTILLKPKNGGATYNRGNTVCTWSCKISAVPAKKLL